MKKAEIICRNNKPYGIRDETGFLFFFAEIHKFDSPERYRAEVEEQNILARYLLSCLKSRTADIVAQNSTSNNKQSLQLLADRVHEVLLIRLGDQHEVKVLMDIIKPVLVQQ